MRIVILKNSEHVAVRARDMFKNILNEKQDAVLGLATGSTPTLLYQKLIESYKAGEMSFAQATSFNLDEYWGLAADHPQSYRSFMQQHLFSHIDIKPENIHIPLGIGKNPEQICATYEADIKAAGGIDIQLLGIGSNGHIGFNEPSSGLCSRTRIKTLTQQTIRDNARFFSADELQPQLSITMGIGTILESKQALLIATGHSKAKAIRAAIEGPLSASCPASALQMHKNVVFLIDEAAASDLECSDFYRHVEHQQLRLLSECSETYE